MKTRFFHVRNTPEMIDKNRHEDKFHWKLNEAITYAAKKNQINLIKSRGKVLYKTLDPMTIHAFTVCIIENDNRHELARGYAFCSPSDQFSKKHGRQISEGRARKMLADKGIEFIS